MSKSKNKDKTKKKTSPKSSTGNFSVLFGRFLNSKFLGPGISLLYFVVVGIVSFTFHKVGDYGVETDFFWGYVPQAKEFLDGIISIDAFRGPLYPIVLGLFGFVISDFFQAGVLIGVLSGATVLFFTFELIKKIFSPTISFFATLMTAFNPVFIQYSYSAGTDMFFIAIASATLFFFFKEKQLSYKNLIIAAVLGGLSYLTRYNGVFLLGFIVVILFVNYWNLNRIKRIQSSAIFLAVFILTFSPWGIYCLSEKGSFFYNENYKNIAYELHGKGKIGWDDFWFNESDKITSLTDVVFSDIGVFSSKVISNVGDHFVNDMDKLMGWHLGVFIILGLILIMISNPFKNWKTRETGYYITNLFFFVLLLLIFYSERFSLFLIPFYSVLVVQPFFIEKFKTGKFIPPKFAYVLMIGLIAFTLVKSYSFNSSRINSGPKELLVLRDWYNDNIPEERRGKKIAARKAHVAYYLDMQFQLLPMAESYEDLIAKLNEKKIDYLYFSTIEAAMRRQFQFLLDPKQIHPGLETVVYFESPPAVLYRVLRE